MPAPTTKDGFSFCEEAAKLFYVGIPSVAVQFNLYVIFPIAAGTVGRVLGPTDLAAFSLGTLAGGLSCLSVVVGTLSAADTLMPRAYGAARYEELGRLAVRSVAVCAGLLLPVVAVLSQAEWIQRLLSSLGQDAVVATKAARWIQVYLFGVPANVLFRTIQRFCVAQHRPWPPVMASLMPSLVMFRFLVQRCVNLWGLWGSALALVTCQWMMCLMLLVHLRLSGESAYRAESWPGLSVSFLKESLALQPLRKFVHLSVGGVAALSEWWFWECMCFVAGTFGVVQFCAYIIAYNVIPLCFMLPMGLGIGLTVRIGAILAHDPAEAKKLAAWTLLMAAVAGSSVGAILYSYRERIIGLFTTEDDVFQQCYIIWGRVCYYVAVLYVFGINGAILRALAMQWTMAAVLAATLWLVALPTILWFSVHKEGGLESQWTLLPVFYTLLQCALASCYIFFDWKGRSREIRHSLNHQLALSDLGSPSEQQTLLPEHSVEL